jgi:hypothetical protein
MNCELRTYALLKDVLDEACQGMPGGGSHEFRSQVAAHLLSCPEPRKQARDELLNQARRALWTSQHEPAWDVRSGPALHRPARGLERDL